MNGLEQFLIYYVSGYIVAYFAIKYSTIKYDNKNSDIKWSVADRDDALKYSAATWLGLIAVTIMWLYECYQNWLKKRRKNPLPRNLRKAKW